MLRSFFNRIFRRPRLPELSDLDRAAIEQVTGHALVDLSLYKKALTHRSLFRSNPESKQESNERLEFLGDAILGMVVAEYLFKKFADRDEGFLTRLRAKLVNKKALAESATALKLGELILMSKAIAATTGRTSESILSDTFEAIIGAVYLDLGMEAARAFIVRTVLERVNLMELASLRDNYKSNLLEFAQARQWPQPSYRVKEETGPSHDKIFTVEVFLSNKRLGEGTAKSKKEAEQIAADEALKTLLNEDVAAD